MGPETQLTSTARTLFERIQSTEIGNANGFSSVGNLLRQVKLIAAQLNDHHAAAISAAYKAHQEAIKARDTALAALHLDEAEDLAKSKMAAFYAQHPEVRVEGIYFTDEWRPYIQDESKIPREYLKPDLAKISVVVAALKKDADIPGVKAVCRKKVTVRK